jgi:hypothetical protein
MEGDVIMTDILTEAYILIETKMEKGDSDTRRVQTKFRGVFSSEEAARVAFEKLKNAESLGYITPEEGGVLASAMGDHGWHKLFLLDVMEGDADLLLSRFDIDLDI